MAGGLALAVGLAVAAIAPEVPEPGCGTASLASAAALVWCGCEATRLTPEVVADSFAPILWFSPNEPLLPIRSAGGGDRLPLIRVPAALPSDHPDGNTPIVYYELTSIDTGPAPAVHEGCPPAGAFDLSRVRSAILTYYFYFPADRGLAAHAHDLEKAQIEVAVRSIGVGCYKLSLRRATGFGHGLNWSANRLLVPEESERAWEHRASAVLPAANAIPEDLRRAHDLALRAAADDAARERLFPITLLVEEGKHGICPDRNGDGGYTPGYDVNRFVNDAWGVRDSFGSKHVGARYSPEMTKVRQPGDRLFPSHAALVTWRSDAVRQAYQCGSHLPWDTRQRYEIRRADRALCEPLPDDPHGTTLLGLCEEHHFGAAVSRNPRWLSWEVLVEGVSFSVLHDTAWRAGLAVGFWNVPFADGWVGVRTTWPWRADLFYTPSASRMLDWYVVMASSRRPWLLTEAGFKVRLTTRNLRPFGARLKFPAFMGVRVGIQSDSLPVATDQARSGTPGTFGPRTFRLVVELGGGAW